MSLSFSEIVDFLSARDVAYIHSGAQNITVESFCALPVDRDQALCWARDATALETAQIEDHSQVVVLVPEEFSGRQSGENAYIAVERPRTVYFELLQHFFMTPKKPTIDPTAVVSTSKLGANVSIGAQSYIGSDVIIEDGVEIGHSVVIDCPATIGAGTVIHSGVVIGTDGFGYFKRIDGSIGKIPHFGGVMIGENVEIGANACIDKGTLANTVIEDGVKIDNLCHIAHNVHIGSNSLIIAQSLVGGSTMLEEENYVAPGATVANHLHVGRHALIGMGAVVTKDVPADTVVAGVPAKVLRSNDHDLF